ncbi:MAG: cob(I)yrinic acid a,c-diamide adenosyltransferase [Firmicutes bacterium]|nr:cob(I)yrinic acid a,c-diamide adenosyltransferase [Bacillota bacterium]
MDQSCIYVYYGEGKGKTTTALGRGLRSLSKGKKVIMIRFMDNLDDSEISLFKMLEPDFKVFSFEKPRLKGESPEIYAERIRGDIKTAFFFSCKIIDTGECDLLILDGVTDAIESGYISCEDFTEMLSTRPSDMELVLTGIKAGYKIRECADYVYRISIEKSPGA